MPEACSHSGLLPALVPFSFLKFLYHMLVCKKTTITIRFLLAAAACLRRTSRSGTPGVADAGVMKYNGKYYIGGVRYKRGFLCIR